MIGAGTAAYVVPYLREEVAREVFVCDPNAIVGGPFAMLGTANPVDGGYRVSGRWPFASGCEHSQWLIGGCVIAGSEPRATRTVLLPAGQCEIIDTWQVSGLRATGSHDIQVRDVFVPEERALTMDAADRTRHEPLYDVKFFLSGHAAQALGVARHALDAFHAYATQRSLGGGVVAARPLAQMRFAQAEALVGAARAYILATVADAWESARAGQGVSREQGARVRLAMTTAVHNAAEAVGLLYDAAGGAAIYTSNPFERLLRDSRVATQHAAVATPSWESAGRGLLGLGPDADPL
jgi:alkylation response protein AidB-like acyl-CoA dehydrogenase